MSEDEYMKFRTDNKSICIDCRFSVMYLSTCLAGLCQTRRTGCMKYKTKEQRDDAKKL